MVDAMAQTLDTVSSSYLSAGSVLAFSSFAPFPTHPEILGTSTYEDVPFTCFQTSLSDRVHLVSLRPSLYICMCLSSIKPQTFPGSSNSLQTSLIHIHSRFESSLDLPGLQVDRFGTEVDTIKYLVVF
jgi:hypothetical protein